MLAEPLILRPPGGVLPDGGLPGAGVPAEELETLLRSSAGRRLLCRFCGTEVTRQGERIMIAGNHVHRRVNPAGFEFVFGCFAEATGALVVGEPTDEHSWFAGYAWQYSLCAGCGAHLGWYFVGQEPSFHGLVLDRLEEEIES